MRTGGTLEECHALLLIALRCADSRRVKWVGRKARKSLHRCWYFIYAFSIGFFVALCLIDLKIELSLFQTFNSNPAIPQTCIIFAVINKKSLTEFTCGVAAFISSSCEYYLKRCILWEHYLKSAFSESEKAEHICYGLTYRCTACYLHHFCLDNCRNWRVDLHFFVFISRIFPQMKMRISFCNSTRWKVYADTDTVQA